MSRAEKSSGSDRVQLWAPRVGLLAVVGLVLAHAASFWVYTNDDAFITFRYSRLLATGHGPFFNVGEHVEGYTNFLLMLLMVPVYWIGGEAAVPLFAKALGVLCGVGSALAVWALTRVLLAEHETLKSHASLIGVGAAALVAGCPQYALNTTSGLETALFGFLLTSGLYMWVAPAHPRRRIAARVLWSALVLCRPEGALLFGLCWFGLAYASWQRRPDSSPPRESRQRGLRMLANSWWGPVVMDGIVVTAVFGAHLFLRWSIYDGEWLPNTYYAKAGGFWKLGAWSYIRKGIVAPFFNEFGIAIGLLGALLWTRRASVMGMVWIGGVAGAALPFVTGTDWMPGYRLLMPYLPIMACVVAIGWCVLAARIVRRRPFVVTAALLLSAVVLGVVQRPAHKSMHDVIALRARGYETGHRQAALWLRDQALPGDGIALMDIGMIGYLCIDQTIIDVTGITDRFIARSPGSFLKKEYDPEYVLDRDPRFVVLVLTTLGQSYTPPPAGARYRLWSPMEQRLYRHPEFRRRYMRTRPVSGADQPWLEALAARVGAERIFEHGNPRKYYLLAVFEKNTGVA